MKFGITFWPARRKIIVPLAKKADETGFESVWMGEHVVFPSRIETQYPYRDVDAPLATTPLYDPIVTFGYLAAVTRRVKLGTSVYVLPLRHPLNVARMLVTLDALSEGRFLFGVGVGWLREELEALGVEYAGRGRRTEEMVTILKRAWSEPRFAHSGEFFRFPEIGFEPKPVHGSIPILFGGKRMRHSGVPHGSATGGSEFTWPRSECPPFWTSSDACAPTVNWRRNRSK